jgi:preprotein translocase SecE subunit
MNLVPYKWPQGRVIRYVAATVCLSYVGYAAYSFWAWQGNAPLPLVGGEADPAYLKLGFVGALALLLAGSAVTYLTVFAHAKLTDYLIAVEGEMRKVYWPKVKPWFSWGSELWGSTYVVIIVVIILSVFLQAIDLGLAPLARLVFH